MPRLVGLLFVALVAFGCSAQAASAASLSLTAPDQQQPQPLQVTASGGADEPSKIFVYGERGGTSCGATLQEHINGRSITFLATADVAPGTFAVAMTEASGQQHPTGAYRFCGYLTRTVSPEASATATATATYTAPTCPTAAFTITGVTDGGPGGATIGVQVPGQGALTATGASGGTGSTSANAAGPVSLQVVAGAAGQTASSRGTPVSETFVVTFERRLFTPCAAPDGTEVTSVRESRQTVVTFKPSGNGSIDGGDGVEAPKWFRAVGGADLLNLYGKPGVVNQIGPVCNAGCEEAAATVTIKVSAATKKRYKLPSRTIAKSGAFKPRGEAVFADIKASKAMIKRLKKAKVKKLTTTVTLDARSPIDETVTRQQVFRVGRFTPNSVTYKRFCIGTAKDALCGSKKR